MAMRGQVLLTLILTKLVGKREGGRERRNRKKREKRRDFRERESTLSLDFPTIGLSNLGETRGKVDPHYKSYAWVLEFWSFDNSGR